MLGEVNVLVLSSMWRWLVPAHAKARLGIVSVGAEANQWSQTAKPRASPEITGNISGVNMPMMSLETVPDTTGYVGSPASQPSVYAKFWTKPWFVETGGVGGVFDPNSCALVAA